MSLSKFSDPGKVVTVEDLQEFRIALLKDIKKIMASQPAPLQKPWMKSHEVRKLLKISHGTLQHLRDSGQLKFSKVGGIIFYDVEDIQKMIKRDEM